MLQFIIQWHLYECYEISKEFDNPTKIIADGGFKTIRYIKAWHLVPAMLW
jgi:hypothetical protein